MTMHAPHVHVMGHGTMTIGRRTSLDVLQLHEGGFVSGEGSFYWCH